MTGIRRRPCSDLTDDLEAFSELYRVNGERIHWWLVGQVGDVGVATDLTAETFAVALEGIDRFRGDTPEAAVAWLFGIARNLIRRWHHDRRVAEAARRRLQMSVPSWVPDEIEAVQERVDAEGVAGLLEAALADLPPGVRDALQLYVVEGLSNRETAAALGLSEANVRMRVSRGLARLRRRLDEERHR